MQTLRTKGLSEPVTLKNLPTLRQAFIVASLLIFMAFVLTIISSPYFIFLALLPAFGMMIAGLTGFCPMVYFLQKLSWNKEPEILSDFRVDGQ